MNLLVIMLDSFRYDHVSSNHRGAPAFADVPACRTPHIDRLAAESLVFDEFYPEGLPTIPVRTALMTGDWTLTNRPWQPLTDTDVTIAEILRREGYTCGLVTDTYHYRAPGMNFHRGFHGRSFLPVIKGERDTHRQAVIMGYFARPGRGAPDRCIRDGAWSLIERMDGRMNCTTCPPTPGKRGTW